MILSPRTLAILNSFANISAGFIASPGNIVSTVSPTRDVFAIAQIEEEFPVEVCFYNLSEFLALVKALKTPDLEFNKNYVQLAHDKYTLRYAFGNTSLVPKPPTKFTPPKPILSHTVSEADWGIIQNLAATLKADTLGVGLEMHNSEWSFFVSIGMGKTSDGAFRSIPNTLYSETPTKVNVKTSLLSLLKDEYTITLYEGGHVLKMEGTKQQVSYYFAGEAAQ